MPERLIRAGAAPQRIVRDGANPLVVVGSGGPAGPPGPAGGVIQILAGVTVSGHIAVATNSVGRVIPADNGVTAHAYATLGVTAGAAVSGAVATVISAGILVEPSWAWTPQLPVYVGAAGALTQTPPTGAGRFSLVVGAAVTATSLWIDLHPPIILAS